MALSSRYGGHTGIINLEVILEDIHKNINEAVINTALDIHGTLRSAPPKGTPIDTGWASTNWHISVDAPSNNKIGSKSNVVAVDTSVANVAMFDINKNNFIFIQNNVPYMARLNRGWSKQSPKGFVESAVDSAMLRNGLIG